MASGINTAFQIWRVFIGAEEMNETVDPETRTYIMLCTWLLIPLILAPVLYYAFVYSIRLVEYLGNVFFPETPKQGGASRGKSPAKAVKGSPKPRRSKKVD